MGGPCACLLCVHNLLSFLGYLRRCALLRLRSLRLLLSLLGLCGANLLATLQHAHAIRPLFLINVGLVVQLMESVFINYKSHAWAGLAKITQPSNRRIATLAAYNYTLCWIGESTHMIRE